MRVALYGWQASPGRYCLSRVPPDLPQLAPDGFATIASAEAHALEQRAAVVWSGSALTEKQHQDHRAWPQSR